MNRFKDIYKTSAAAKQRIREIEDLLRRLDSTLSWLRNCDRVTAEAVEVCIGVEFVKDNYGLIAYFTPLDGERTGAYISFDGDKNSWRWPLRGRKRIAAMDVWQVLWASWLRHFTDLQDLNLLMLELSAEESAA